MIWVCAIQLPFLLFCLQENNVLLDQQNLVCQGPRDLIWIIVIYAYLLITQLIAVILAFKTRKVEIEILNDAKYIALIIYITTIIVIVMIVCAVLLSNYLNADGAVFGGLLYIFITTVLMIVFVPKVKLGLPLLNNITVIFSISYQSLSLCSVL